MRSAPQLASWSYGQGKNAPELRLPVGKSGYGFPPVPAGPHSNVFVGNMPSEMTEANLSTLFSPYGDIESCRTMTKAGKTCGFVKFRNTASAERAIAELNGMSGLLVKVASSSFGRTSAKGAGKKTSKGGPGKPPWAADPPWGWGGGGWGWGGWSHFPPTKWSKPTEEDDGPEPPPDDNVYVTSLPVGITEGEVRDTFSKVGHVVELRMLRTGISLECAALVRMATVSQAMLARTRLDGVVADGILPPLIARLQTKNGKTLTDHVYVRNIPMNSVETKVNELFMQYGTVKWSAILPVAAGQWRGNGPSSAALVEMGSDAEAAEAVKGLDGRILQMADVAPPMKVRYAENRSRPEESVTPSTNLYIKGWPVGFPEFVLKATFQQWGTVVRLRIIENADPEQPTCAALVQMSSLQEAAQAMRTLQGQTLFSPLPPMTIKFARKDQAPGDNLYIMGLPRTITEAAVRATFANYNPILRLRLLVQPGRPETHALVQLSSAQVAEAAMKELNGTAPRCKGPTIVVSFAANRPPPQ